MSISERLKSLRSEMCRHNIDAYIVPTCDFHGSEEIGDYFKTRQYISGFTGSAGTAVITQKEALLWTDGRYFLQAEAQLKGSEFVLMKSEQPKVPTVKQYLKSKIKKGYVVGFDGRMMMASEAEDISSIDGVKINYRVDLIGAIWEDRPELPCTQIWELPESASGEPYLKKIKRIRKEMSKSEADILLLTSLEEIAWTLNLRANDIACTPVFMSYMIITKNDSILFVHKQALSDEIREKLKRDGVTVRAYNEIYDALEQMENRTVWIDKETANCNVIKSISEQNKMLNQFTPVLAMKAVKNRTEIRNMRQAHLMDGVAMTKFIYWLKSNVGKIPMTEISLGEKLEEFRSAAAECFENEPERIANRASYLGPSFPPIVGYNEHGAIVHYSATQETNEEIKPEGMVLIDSGGHYMEGTTDVTRTISLGSVSEKMKEMYTAVLRGNLNLAAAVFKEGCSGVSLDYIARKPLWDKGLDYNHGTGHGVGYVLNVHELPNGIRYRILPNLQLNAVLEPGMITSNEPGIYLEGEFGIRIENLILCVKKKSNEYGTFLGFETLTLIPFDKELINLDDMTTEEQKLLKKYNDHVYKKLSPFLTEEESVWLKNNCRLD